MFLSMDLMENLEGEVDDIFGGESFKEKISKYYESSSSNTKGQTESAIDVSGESWPLTIFLTPPSSPDNSPTYEEIFLIDEKRLNENRLTAASESDDILDSGASRTKDLKSMLIRDCMWNGESPKKGRHFEKFRSLTKTPPLVDCNLRIMYVDPSEIWPFNFNEQQLKAGKNASVENNNDNAVTDEDVDVDVVGLEGSQKVDDKKKNVIQKYIKKEKCKDECENELQASSSCNEDAETCPPQCSEINTDHDYSCKLRSGIKRRRSSDSESDIENYTEQKTRVLSGDESDQDCEILGRATHNVLERKRRNELKMRFEFLRDSIPDISGNDRAPKVSILQKAYGYILQLQAEERNLAMKMRAQKNRKEQLLEKVLEMQNDDLSAF